MSNSIYHAWQALGYYYATQRVREEYDVTTTSTLDQQLDNLTSLPLQICQTCMYTHQPAPPMYYDQTHGFYQPMQYDLHPPTPPMHYDYTPRFYQLQSYEPPPPPPQLAKVPLLRI